MSSEKPALDPREVFLRECAHGLTNGMLLGAVQAVWVVLLCLLLDLRFLGLRSIILKRGEFLFEDLVSYFVASLAVAAGAGIGAGIGWYQARRMSRTLLEAERVPLTLSDVRLLQFMSSLRFGLAFGLLFGVIPWLDLAWDRVGTKADFHEVSLTSLVVLLASLALPLLAGAVGLLLGARNRA